MSKFFDLIKEQRKKDRERWLEICKPIKADLIIFDEQQNIDKDLLKCE